MKKVVENIEIVKQRMNSKSFAETHENGKPNVFEVIAECGNEICVIIPTQILTHVRNFKFWKNRDEFGEIQNDSE